MSDRDDNEEADGPMKAPPITVSPFQFKRMAVKSKLNLKNPHVATFFTATYGKAKYDIFKETGKITSKGVNVRSNDIQPRWTRYKADPQKYLNEVYEERRRAAGPPPAPVQRPQPDPVPDRAPGKEI